MFVIRKERAIKISATVLASLVIGSISSGQALSQEAQSQQALPQQAQSKPVSQALPEAQQTQVLPVPQALPEQVPAQQAQAQPVPQPLPEQVPAQQTQAQPAQQATPATAADLSAEQMLGAGHNTNDDGAHKHTVVSSAGKWQDVPWVSWTDPDQPVRAILLCIHGMGLHGLSYEAFGKRMAVLGFPTYAIDVRGFGGWLDDKGMGKVDFPRSMADVQEVLEYMDKTDTTIPIILIGESMGGAIALQATALHPNLVDGLVTAVPGAKRYKSRRTNMKVAMGLIRDPKKPVDIGKTIVRQAIRDPQLQDEWDKDPQRRTVLMPKELVEFQKFMDGNISKARLIEATPVLMLMGVQDQLVKQGGNLELFNAMPAKDKNLLMIGSAEHLVFEEGQFNEDVIDSVIHWISKHCPTRSSATVPEKSPH